MKCPKCNVEMTGTSAPGGQNVIDSRPVADNGIRRRRECQQCKHRFTTYEYVGGVLSTAMDELGKVFDSGLMEVLVTVQRMRAGAVKVCAVRGQAPEDEGTDRPQRELGSGEVDGAVSVGSSR